MTGVRLRAVPRSQPTPWPALRLAESVPKPVSFWKVGALAVCYRWLFPEVALSSSPGPTPGRRGLTASIDWRRAAPRWLLVLVTVAALAGWYEATTSRQSRLEQAIADAPSKTQARLETRLTVVESRQDASEARERAREAREEAFHAAMMGAINGLTIEVREVKVEMRLRRRQ